VTTHVLEDAPLVGWVRALYAALGLASAAVLTAAQQGNHLARQPTILIGAVVVLSLLPYLVLSRPALLLRYVRVRDGVLTAPLLTGPARIDLRRLRCADARVVHGRHSTHTVLRLVDDDSTLRLWFGGRAAMRTQEYAALWEALAAPGVPTTARARELLRLPGGEHEEPPARPLLAWVLAWLLAWLLVGALLFAVLVLLLPA
jgi:hypothetical protein